MRHGKISKNLEKKITILRKRIEKAKISPSILDESINIATWNIREFGKKPRREESIHYIAEILHSFDLISITELRNNLDDLKRVMKLLGTDWQVIYSDIIPDHGGNKERIAYLFDTRTVHFTGLAAEADPPRKKKDSEYIPQVTWWRSPYMASFESGSIDFILLTAHIRWGKTLSSREAPLRILAEWIDKRLKEPGLIDKDIILMGDFNIPNTNSKLYRAITSKGLKIPHALRGSHGTNLVKDKRYDQILHYSHTNFFSNKGGVVDFYKNNHRLLYPNMEKGKFTYQLSDHFPLWIQIKTDAAD